MKKQQLRKFGIVLDTYAFSLDPALGDPPAPGPPQPEPDAVARARFEADTARAEAERLKTQLEAAQKAAMTDEQRARLAAADAAAQQAEEERMKKAGEFDAWRAQTNERHSREIAEEKQRTEEAARQAAKTEQELNDTLIGLAFSGATDWFGPTGKTVLTAEIAKAYFGGSVSVDVKPGQNGTLARRTVIVRDGHGTTILDTKTGQPAEFSKAIGDLIEAHPQRNHILRGSGKSGSGSPGGGNSGDHIDINRLRQKDFHDPAVREKVRESQAVAGGLKVGPGFDAIERGRRNK